jgi:glycosyltransferase involved in cell wall biosynthesis
MDQVSIIIPVYNNATQLHHTINSALNQTYPNIEIIVIDDGSTDESFVIAKKFENINVKIFSQENAGAGVARNKGLSVSTGKYIQFLDAGDLISSNKIEEQVKSLNGRDDILAVCGYIKFKDYDKIADHKYNDQSHFIYSTNDTLEFLVNLWGGFGDLNFIQTNSWLVPKKLITTAGKWRNYRCPDDDGEFFSRVILASEGIVYVPSVYNYYNISSIETTHLSNNQTNKYLQNILLTIDLKYQYVLAKGNHPNLSNAIASQYYRFAVDVYPFNKLLYKLAYKKFKRFNVSPPDLILGGKIIQIIKALFGWRVARTIKYYLQ